MKKLYLLLLITLLDAKVLIVNENVNISAPIQSWIEIKNKYLSRQKHDYSCGSASLSTILKYYYNQNISEKEILDAVMKMKGLTKNSSLEEYKRVNGLSFLDLSIFSFPKDLRLLVWHLI